MYKTVLITGSTRGIGKQIGLDLLKDNYFVYFNGRTQDSINNLYKEINSINSHKIIKADLSYIEDIDKISQSIDNIDILILNAGITDRTSFGEISLEDWNHVFNVNLTNQFFLIQNLKDKIRENGKIIFISSIAGLMADSVSISYGVSKGAINVLVPYLAKVFADKKITVNAIAPGFVESEWHKTKSKAQIKRIAKKCLANRFGTTEEISKLVQSIINNDFINGQVIRCCGGYNL